MDAIVMAAGEGRRMRPLTEAYAKPVLPIDGEPVLGRLLRELAGAGSERATVVTGHLAEQVEALLGDGTAFGLSVAFVRQPTPEGSADAVGRALQAGASTPTLVTAADTVYGPGDIARFVAAFHGSRAAGSLAVRPGYAPSADKPGVAVENGRVRVVYEPESNGALTSAPLWVLGPAIAPFLEDLPGPPFELRDAYQRAIDSGLDITAVEIGKTRDLTYPLDLVRENFPYLSEL